MPGVLDPILVQQLRRTYKYFKDYRQVSGGVVCVLGSAPMPSSVSECEWPILFCR